MTLNQEIPAASIGNLTFVPVANGNGTPYTQFGFMLGDGITYSVAYTATMNITAVNDPPSIQSLADSLGYQSSLYAYVVSVTDPETPSSSLIYNSTTLPSWLSFGDIRAQIQTFYYPNINQMDYVRGMDVDSARKLIYFTLFNAYNQVFRMDMNTGTIRNFQPSNQAYVGTGTQNTINSTDPTLSRFDNPISIAINQNTGFAYVGQSNVIRKLDTNGTTSTYATGITKGSGLAYDAVSGALYVADSAANKIWYVAPGGGAATVFAGSGTAGTVDGKGTAAQFNGPSGITLLNGVLYVTQPANHVIRKINLSDTSVTVYAGVSATTGTTSGYRTSAKFNKPWGIKASNTGVLYITDVGNNKIRRIYNDTVYNFAGNGTSAETDGVDTLASFKNLGNLAIGKDNAIYVASSIGLSGNVGRIRKILPPYKGFVGTPGNGDVGTHNASQISSLTYQAPTNMNGSAVASFTFHVNDGTVNSASTYTATMNVTAVNDVPVIVSSANTSATQGSSYRYILYGNDVENPGSKGVAITKPSWLTVSTKAYVSKVDSIVTSGVAYNPVGLVVDTARSVIYFADTATNSIYKMNLDGTNRVLFAGNSASFTTTDGTGTAASFKGISALSIDGSGNLYVAEGNGGYVIRKVTPTAVVTTIAGNGTSGVVDNAAALSATVGDIYDMTLDKSRNYLYFSQNNMIRRMTLPTGPITTIAGGIASGSSNGNGTAASFNTPWGLALDTAGNLLIAERYNNKIRKYDRITTAVTTYVGTGTASMVNGTGASNITLDHPYKLAVDKDNNLYISQHETAPWVIRKVTNGLVSSFYIGDSTSTAKGYVNDTTTAATVGKVPAMAIMDGVLYFAQASSTGGGRMLVRKVAPSLVLTGTPTNADVGSHNVKLAYTDGTDTTFQTFTVSVANVNDAPTSGDSTMTLVEDQTLSLNKGMFKFSDMDFPYTGDTLKQIRILETPNLGYLKSGSTILSPATISVDDIASYAAYIQPDSNRTSSPLMRLAYQVGDGTAFSVDTNYLYFNVTAVNDAPSFTSTPVTTALPKTPYSYQITTSDVESKGLTVSFNSSASNPSWLSLSSSPYVSSINVGTKNIFGLVVDTARRVMYYSDITTRKIYRANLDGSNPVVFAGSGTQAFADGVAEMAAFYEPQSMTMDTLGNLYVADGSESALSGQGYKIRKISPWGKVITIAGNGTQSIVDNVNPLNASFHFVKDLAYDHKTNLLYIADRFTLRVMDISTGLVQTLAGSTSSGNLDGFGTAARMNFVAGLALDSAGNVLFSDMGNNKIRKYNVANSEVTTYAGSGSSTPANSTGAAQIGLPSPVRIALDKEQNLFVSSYFASKMNIRKITPTLTSSYYVGDTATTAQTQLDGYGTTAKLGQVKALVYAAGSLYATDMGNGSVDALIRPIETRYKVSGTPAKTDTGAIPVSLSVTDGQVSTLQDYIINIPYVNESPDFKDTTLTFSEDGSITLDTGMIQFSDLDTPYRGDTLISLKVVSLPGSGTLTLNDVPVSLNQIILKSEIASLNFKSDANAFGTPYAAIGFKVYDGHLYDTTTNYIVLNVNSVNDLPEFTSTAVVDAYEGNVYNYYVNGYDVENVNPDFAKITGPSWLSLSTNPYKTVSTLIDFQSNVGSAVGSVLDPSENWIYVADGSNHTIRSVKKDGSSSEIWAGQNASSGNVDGDRLSARFWNIKAMTADTVGNLYVIDQNGTTLRKISATGTVSTLLNGASGLGTLSALTYDVKTNRLYGFNTNNYGVRVVDLNTLNYSTVAGGNGPGFVDGMTGNSYFKEIYSMTTDTAGNLYLADVNNRSIRKVAAGNFYTSTIYGNSSSVAAPQSVTWDKYTKNVYILDANHQLIQVDTTGAATVYAGKSSASAGYLDARSDTALLGDSRSILKSASGHLYLTQLATSNTVIRSVVPATKMLLSGTPSAANVNVTYPIKLSIFDGTDSTYQDFNVFVHNVNDAPTSKDTVVALDEDTELQLTQGMFRFADIDPTGDTLTSVKITATVGVGSLTLDGTVVANNQIIPVADLNKLKFVPLANGMLLLIQH